jgi:hypothetical protein
MSLRPSSISLETASNFCTSASLNSATVLGKWCGFCSFVVGSGKGGERRCRSSCRASLRYGEREWLGLEKRTLGLYASE